MTSYALLYRIGLTPWERYESAASASIAILFDREQAGRTRPLGRALDLGCGRGLYTAELAKRGWEAVGIDYVPTAIAAPQTKDIAGATYVVGDVTQLPTASLGKFDFFLDIGCFQGLDTEQRQAMGRGVTTLANPGATLLMLAFGRSPLRAWVGGVSKDEVATAFPEWTLVAVDPAQTEGLGWPMNKTSPRWYRLRSSQ